MTLSRGPLFLLTLLAMLAFAANSVLCRLALKQTHIDAGQFTALRLISGALVLGVLIILRERTRASEVRGKGNWPSALALLAYAAGFSYAYVGLPTATGALLLFGAVQVTMIGHGLLQGDTLRQRQWLGLLLACSGLLVLLLPGLSTPPLGSALLMVVAGVAWGIYSLRGQGAGNPLDVSAGNFARAASIALALAVFLHRDVVWDPVGIGYAVASGGIASGVGYAVWYWVLPSLRAVTAATVQLSVPVIAGLAGTLLLAEPLAPRLLLAAAAVLGGIALVVMRTAGRTQD